MSEPTLISLDCWIEVGSFLPRSVRPPPPPDDVPLLLSLPPQAASMASSAPCLRLVPTIALASPSLVVGPRRPDDGPNVPHVPRLRVAPQRPLKAQVSSPWYAFCICGFSTRRLAVSASTIRPVCRT